MDSAKFLRALADLISAAQESPTENIIKSDETPVMVPPLQQEIELMKKATNVDSVFDKTENVDDQGENENTTNNEIAEIGSQENIANDELTILKKMRDWTEV